MRKPDLFIVGAPKCGTTAMYEYLRRHPEIFMSPVKEPYYFGSDLRYRSPRPTLEEYLGLFEDAEHEKRAGEASTGYLVSRRAAHEIREFQPDARIIIMLRNPVDVIRSQHRQLLKAGQEDVDALESALELEPQRRRGSRIPPGCRLVNALWYMELVAFTDQVERYFDAFGRERTRVIIFDDFESATAACYSEILRFLEVDPRFSPDSFEVVNPSAEVRSVRIRRILQHPAVRLAIGKVLIPSPWLRRRLGDKLHRLNERRAPSRPIDPSLRRRLQADLETEVQRLSELLGRDLTHWTATGG